jgi:CarD family transcriptional regulator
MFQIGDYVVCPGHGVGQLREVEEKSYPTGPVRFYIVRIISNGLSVMIPCHSKDGIRSLASGQEIEAVFGLLQDHQVPLDHSTWNRRHREYLAKIKTGSLLEIADVLRALFLLKRKKVLSFGEKKMLEQCRDLIVQEVVISGSAPEDAVMARIDSIFQ